MRKAPYLLSVIGISFLSLANSSSASPLASGLNDGATLPALTDGSVEKVQLWSCRERLRDMTPSQRRFCFGYGYGPRYGYAYPRYGYGYGYPRYGYGYRRYGYGYPRYGYGYRRYGYGYGYPGYGLALPLFGFGLGYWAGRHWDD
jgi:hypothetical protein